MRTLSVYEFNELTDDAKKSAINDFRDTFTEVFWADEILNSLKGLFQNCNGIKLKNYSLGEYNSSIDVEFSQDEAGELSGKRALAWLENNLLSNIRYLLKATKDKNCENTGRITMPAL